MAEKKEPGLWNTMKKGAIFGALALLGLEGALLVGVPALLINTIVNLALTGALYGGLIGGAIALVGKASNFISGQFGGKA